MEQQMYREWRAVVAPRHNKVSEAPRRYEWRESRQTAPDGTRYTERALYADIDMQWRKGEHIRRGWQFIASLEIT